MLSVFILVISFKHVLYVSAYAASSMRTVLYHMAQAHSFIDSIYTMMFYRDSCSG